MHRVFFDGNSGPGDTPDDPRFGLWFETSLQDLAALGDELKDGLRIIIYSPGELEMEAVLEFDAKHDAWMAIGDGATIRYLAP